MAYLAALNYEEAQAATNYCRYVHVRVGQTPCSALVDSGNVWRNAISAKFLKKLGLTMSDLRPLTIKTIGTAKAGSDLKVLGELKTPLHLKLGGAEKIFKTRPVVIQGLAMPLNLSGPFLKLHGIDQLHSKDSLRVQGRDIALVNAAGKVSRPQTTLRSAVYSAEEVTVPPRCVAFLRLRASEVERGLMTAGEFLLEGGEKFMESTDLHPCVAAVVNCASDGLMAASVMNTTPEQVVIKRGQFYGTVTAMGQWADGEEEWSLNAIDAGSLGPGARKVTAGRRRKKGKLKGQVQGRRIGQWQKKESGCRRSSN